jgi:hypothetical protein
LVHFASFSIHPFTISSFTHDADDGSLIIFTRAPPQFGSFCLILHPSIYNLELHS